MKIQIRNFPIRLALITSIVVLVASCRKKDDPITPPTTGPVEEQELITTLAVHLHSLDGTQHLHLSFRDLDGDGGNPPMIDLDTLTANTIYEVHVELLNESVNPVIDITEEVEEEGDLHQFFYQVDNANLSITYDDQDVNGRPIGIHTTWTTGDVSTGSLKITLRHEPDKAADGVSQGDITNAGGDTDIEVELPLTIE
jgi:hypothetical protein